MTMVKLMACKCYFSYGSVTSKLLANVMLIVFTELYLKISSP